MSCGPGVARVHFESAVKSVVSDECLEGFHEGGAVSGGERCEEIVLGCLDLLLKPAQVRPSELGQADRVSTPVARISRACRIPFFLEVVQECDHVAAVDAEAATQLGLAGRAVLGKRCKYGEVTAVVGPVDGVRDHPDRGSAELEEQPGGKFPQHAGRRFTIGHVPKSS